METNPDTLTTESDMPAAQGCTPEMLLELLQMPACILDNEGNIIALNAAWYKRGFGCRGSESSSPWMNAFLPSDRCTVLSHFRSATLTGRRTELECRLLDDCGSHQWFLINLQPVNDEAASAKRWLCVATDIEKLKLRESHLEKQAAIQTNMLDISVDCIKLIALDGTVVHMNRAGCQALGVADDSGFGMSWLLLLPEEIRPAGDQALAIARAGKFARFPGKSVLPGFKPQYWDNMLTPVMGIDGKATAILCQSACKRGSDAVLMIGAQVAPISRASRRSSFPRPYI